MFQGSVDFSLQRKGTVFVDPALLSPYPINILQPRCGRKNRASRVPISSLTGSAGPDKSLISYALDFYIALFSIIFHFSLSY